MYETVHREAAISATTRRWTPADLGFDSVSWTKAGTNSLDIVCAEMRFFTGYAIANDAWIVRAAVYNETGTAVLWTSGILGTDVGVAGGQTEPLPFNFGPFNVHGYYRMRFRGFGVVRTVTGATLRVYGRSI